MSLYNDEFYKDRHRSTLYAARAVLAHALRELRTPQSAIDIGCGVGTWLSVLQEYGVQDIQGLDGPWISTDYLQIAKNRFRPFDFNGGRVPTFDRRFDLAICLEVAEHIIPNKAQEFIKFLCQLSDQILFSAAIPGQGGVGHVNEQWPSYWIERFELRGYILLDTLRPLLWNDENIPYWYRQNLMMFCRSPQQIDSRNAPSNFAGMSIVHPALFKEKTAPMYVRATFVQLLRAIRSAIRRRLAN